MRGTLRESNSHRPCGDSPSPQPSPRKRGEGAHRRCSHSSISSPHSLDVLQRSVVRTLRKHELTSR
ncbi:hypothetical protein C2U70_15485 [Bradyrhizobium guangdongense]|nr:hypothetical protein C2U70_15485 [Bradyrhizobium guangdongense]